MFKDPEDEDREGMDRDYEKNRKHLLRNASFVLPAFVFHSANTDYAQNGSDCSVGPLIILQSETVFILMTH